MIEGGEIFLDQCSISIFDQTLNIELEGRLKVRLELFVDKGKNRIPGFDLHLMQVFRVITAMEQSVPIQIAENLLQQLFFADLQGIVNQRVQQGVEMHRREIDVGHLLIPFLSESQRQEFVIDGDQVAQRSLQFPLIEQDLVFRRRLRRFSDRHLLEEAFAFAIRQAEVARRRGTRAETENAGSGTTEETIHLKRIEQRERERGVAGQVLE